MGKLVILSLVFLIIFMAGMIYFVYGFYFNPSIKIKNISTSISQRDFLDGCNHPGGGENAPYGLELEIKNNFFLSRDYVLPSDVVCAKMKNGKIAEYLTGTFFNRFSGRWVFS